MWLCNNLKACDCTLHLNVTFPKPEARAIPKKSKKMLCCPIIAHGHVGLHQPFPSFSPISLSSRWDPLPSDPLQPSSPEALFFQHFLRSVKKTSMSLAQRQEDALSPNLWWRVWNGWASFSKTSKVGKSLRFQVQTTQQREGLSKIGLQVKMWGASVFWQRAVWNEVCIREIHVCGLQCTQQSKQNIVILRGALKHFGNLFLRWAILYWGECVCVYQWHLRAIEGQNETHSIQWILCPLLP